MASLILVLLLLPVSAHAAPVIGAIATYFGVTTTTVILVGQIALTVGMAVYGAAQQRRAEQAAKDAYNASLKDRTITGVATDMPYRYIYGRARVGSAIVAMFTSGSKDQFKHLVCVHAAHECDAIEEIYIAGKALGPLDSSGNVTSGDYFYTTTEYYSSRLFSQTTVFPYDGISGVRVTTNQWAGEGDADLGYTFDPNTKTLTVGTDISNLVVYVSFTYRVPRSRVNVQKHLGAPGQTVDAYLQSVVGSSVWPNTATLSGFTYTVVTLDLNQPEFQGGIPSIEVLARGKKLYDPRTGTTYWNQNPALATYDYLTSEMCGVDAADIPLADVITAANVSDQMVAGGSLAGTDRLYTINGSVSSDEDQAQTLERMAQAMAGGIVATSWRMWAGSYTAPVMALTVEPNGNSDVVGEVAITPGLSDADVYNGVKGRYVGAATSYVETDFPPYQNSVYVSADGKEKWTDLDFHFTDDPQRVHNLCRIYTEDQRNGFTVKGDFNIKTWSLQIGDRVTLTSQVFGWSAKIFRVTDKQYAPDTAVTLTLKEDAPEIWDLADTVTVDETPNTNLPNPFHVTPLGALTCTSGTNELFRQADGTIVSRIHVSWQASTNQAATNGVIEAEWIAAGGTVWNRMQVSGDAADAYLAPVNDGSTYTVRARLRNPSLNVSSDWSYATHRVIGKTEPPPDVAGLFITNGVLSWPEISRNGVPDLAGYRIRFQYGRNAFWGNAAPMHAGLILDSPWRPALIPPGPVTLMLKAVDSTGNESLNTATIYANFGDPIVDNLILTYDDRATGFPGEKTNCAVAGGDLLADDSGDLFWGDDNAPFWGRDAAAFWPTATYKLMTYVASYTVQPDEAGSRLTLLLDVLASSYTVEFRYGTQGEFWGNDQNFFWSGNSAAFWPPPTDWQTWPGAIEAIAEGEIQLRITTQAGFVQGMISALVLQFDVEDESEEINDAFILAGGTRLVLSKTYRSIKNIQLTLQDDGGTAVSAKWADKLVTGPLIYCENNAGAKVSGTIDARIQGVKG